MGKSSKDKRDAYYRLAKEQGWRARSAFKLLQIDEEFDIFAGVTRVVDLCAAPGSWSQVLSRVLIKGETFGRAGWNQRNYELRKKAGMVSAEEERRRSEEAKKEELRRKANNGNGTPRENVKIVAIDLQPMSPLEGIITLQADITASDTIPRLLEALGESISQSTSDDSEQDAELRKQTPPQPVDLIVCDGAPDVTGLHDLDIYIQASLLRAALQLAVKVLKPGGTFIAKIFRAKDCDIIYAQLDALFDSVVVAKPRASRASSLEAFVVCKGFSGEQIEISPSGIGASERKRPKTQPYRIEREDGTIDVELGSDSDSANDHDGLWDDDHPNEIDLSGKEVKKARWLPPFVACGDLSAFDSETTYPLPPGYKTLDPVQPPVAPPYKEALEIRKREGGAYGKTKHFDRVKKDTSQLYSDRGEDE